MEFYKNKRDYLSNVIRAKKGYDDKHLYLYFLTASRHSIQIVVERVGNSVKLQSGLSVRGFSLDKYIDEKEFISDIRKMVGVMAYVSVAHQELTLPLGQLVYEHTKEFGRLCLDDLNTFIAELIMVVNAFAESESGEGLNYTGKQNLISMCMDLVSQEFSSFLQ